MAINKATIRYLMSMATPPYSDAQRRARLIRSALATLILALALALFASAGIWQLNRAGEKEDLNAAFSAGEIVAEVLKPVSDAEADTYRFRRFRLFGRFLPERQILLDSMVAGGRPGYQVLTPFTTGGTTVLVNRGWVPANPDRSVLPSVEVGGEERSITARLNRLPVPGMRIPPPAAAAGWPRRLLFPTRDQIAAELGMDIPDYQLWLEADQPDGYLRDWHAVGVGPERHYGYAIQWFAFAALTLFFYILLNVRWTREQHSQPTDRPHD